MCTVDEDWTCEGASCPPVLDCSSGTEGPGEWATVCAGTFTMGSPESEDGRWDQEVQHDVTLNHDFVILSTEVTQGEFEDLLGYNPSWFSTNGGGVDCGSNCPVEQVNWHEAAAYCNALSDVEGLDYCVSPVV